MSSSNNRFGRRTGEQSNDSRAEPVFSFTWKPPSPRGKQAGEQPPAAQTPPKAPKVDRADAVEFGARSGRDAQRDPIPSFMRGSEPGPRVEREDAEEFGMSGDRDSGPRIDRHDDDFDPRRGPRDKGMDPRVPATDRPLYHHLFDEEEKRGHGFGWAAALGSVVIIAVGAAYAWQNFMSRPTPGSLLDPQSYSARGRNTGYTTPTNNADNAPDSGATPSPLAAMPAAPDQTPTRDVEATPQPKSAPAEPPPPPKKSISEAAANPGNLGPPVTPPPEAATQPVVAPAPVLTPPPKRDAAKADTPKREAPRKEAAITPPKPVPAPVPQDAAPQDVAPPVVAQPAAAPAVSAPPPRPRPPQATGQPQQLNRSAPAAYPPPQQQQQQQAPQQQQQQQQQPNFATRSPPPVNAPISTGPNNTGQNNAAPQPGSPDTVTVDGVTYVSGQEPRALGTLSGQPQAANSDAPMSPVAPALPAQSPPNSSTRYYAPSDHDGGAPLPNDVIILPNGQLAVPNR
jgi:hypothetical protein